MKAPKPQRLEHDSHGHETTAEPAVWQIGLPSASERDAATFLRHGVALLGPGDAGPWNRDPYDGDYHRAIWLLARAVRVGDILLARAYSDTIRAVGVVASDYLHLPQFANVGEGRQHARRVRWRELPGEGRTFPGAFRLISQELSRLDQTDRLALSAAQSACRFVAPLPRKPDSVGFRKLARSRLGIRLPRKPKRPSFRLPPDLPRPRDPDSGRMDIVELTRALAAYRGGLTAGPGVRPKALTPSAGLADFLTGLVFPALRGLGWPRDATRTAAGVALDYIRLRLTSPAIARAPDPVRNFIQNEADAAQRREAVRWARAVVAEAPARWASGPLPPLPPEEPDLGRVPPDVADVVAMTRRAAAAYRHSKASGPPPHRLELAVHLVIPVLLRLGWSRDQIGLGGWALRVYADLPRSSETCRFGMFLSELGKGPDDTTRNGNPHEYAHCADVVTDGVHYRLFEPGEARRASPNLYADLSRPTRSAAELVARLRAPGGSA